MSPRCARPVCRPCLIRSRPTRSPATGTSRRRRSTRRSRSIRAPPTCCRIAPRPPARWHGGRRPKPSRCARGRSAPGAVRCARATGRPCSKCARSPAPAPARAAARAAAWPGRARHETPAGSAGRRRCSALAAPVALGDTAAMTHDDSAGLLGPEGPFARELPNFAPRAAQQAMAAAGEEALAERGTLIAEAGTGTGKTYAYLVPALLSGRRVIVSTGTKTLQDQLFHRDLPRVRAVLGSRVRAALLKGRANYLCRHRLEQTVQDGRLGGREQVSQLAALRDWAARTLRGDRGEVAAIAEASPLWPRVPSTTENCLG